MSYLMEATLPSYVYADINRNWKLQPEDTVTDLLSLRQKILFVIATYKGTRKYRERFGSHVQKYLFEPFDQRTAGWIQSSIFQAIEDPANDLLEDVQLINVVVTPDFRTSSYYVKLQWRAIKLDAAASKISDTFAFNLRSLA